MFGPIFSAALPLVGTALGVAGSIAGGERANAANALMAQKQMDFQREMRNTSYQAAVEDMRKAGLNPALAYQQGGAATPSGASSTAQNTMAGIAGTAAQAVDTYNAIRKTDAEIRAINAQSSSTEFQTGLAQALAPGVRDLQHIQEAMERSTFAMRLEKMRADIEGTNASASQARETARATRLDSESPPWLRGFLGREGAHDVLGLADQWRRRFVDPALQHSAAAGRAFNHEMSRPRNTGRRPWWVREGSLLDPER